MSTHCLAQRFLLSTAVIHLMLLGSLAFYQECIPDLAENLINRLDKHDTAGACDLIRAHRDKRLFLFQFEDRLGTKDSVKVRIITSGSGSYTCWLPFLFALPSREPSIVEIEVTGTEKATFAYGFPSSNFGKGLWRVYVPSRPQPGVIQVDIEYILCRPKTSRTWLWYTKRISPVALGIGGLIAIISNGGDDQLTPIPPLPDPPDYPSRR